MPAMVWPSFNLHGDSPRKSHNALCAFERNHSLMTTFKASFLIAFAATVCSIFAVTAIIYKRAPVVDMRGQHLNPAQAATKAKELTEKSGRITIVRYK